jgi:glutamyl-tRNA synthetase
VQLEWLGIKYDSGPSGPDELFSKFSQRLRLELYHESLELLRKSGHMFACECSRSEIRQISSNENYPGTCRNKKLNLVKGNQTWRILVPVQTLVCLKTFTNKIEKIDVSREMADFVIKRRDGLPAYQLASIMDDLELGVNLVVRGYDLRSSTGAQLYLAKCLNDSIFPETRFVHHVLQTDDAGDKLSKSKGAHSIQMLREKHRNPTWIYQETAKSLNLPFEEIQTLEDLKEVFRSIMILKDGPNSILDHKN